ncbi:MlaD family protein [Nocardia thailandica]|uniref:MlaD family protein n=1 Tax=Nocardia thailandica TaxID=257275 RepID=UPI0002DCD145|nr:MlaD family protein [Nocardia thailandica]
MLHRILGSRGFMSAAVVVTVVAGGATVTHLTRPGTDTRAYCADLPDSIGLYPGSAVTVLGIQVGSVTGIESHGSSARVRFTVRADRTLPTDVGAVTVNDTLIADRQLALIGDEPTGAGRDPGTCITKTLTPESLTETFDALAGLAGQLSGAPGGASGLEALDRATDGTGEQINALVTRLGQALASPDAAIGHLGALLDALAALAHRARNGWNTVEAMTVELPRTFHDIVTIAFPPIVDIVTYLVQVLPQLNDFFMMMGTPAIRTLDSTGDLAAQLAAGAGSLSEVVRRAPAVAAGFLHSVDPTTGQLRIDYAPPKLAVPPADSVTLCAALLAVTGQPCAADGTGTVPALPVLLAAVSAR